MITFDSILLNTKTIEIMDELNSKYIQARQDYELALQQFVLTEVRDCPCCYEKAFDQMKEKIKSRMFYSDFGPDDLEVLQELYITSPVNFKSSF